MANRITARTLRSAWPGVVLAVLPWLPASAQVEEITVSTRRIEESLQTVPVSVSALTDQAIQAAGVRSLSDIVNLIPNVTFESGENGRRAAPTIRGIALIDTRGFDNPVAVFIDGVYIGGRSSQNVRLLDLERVEVIRGPQSALYGRNSFAGAISYVSRRPSDEFRGSAEALAAEDGRYELQGSVSGPLIEGVSGGLAAVWADDQGMFDNAGPLANESNSIGGGDSTAFRGSLRYQPSDATDILFTAFYTQERVDSKPLYVVPNNCGELDPAKTFPTNPGNAPSYDKNVPSYRCSEISEATPGAYSLSPDAYSNDGDTTRLALDMKFEIGAMTLQSISSWTADQSSSKLDLDRTQVGEPYYGFIATADYPNTAFSFNPGTATNAGITNLNTYFGTASTDQEYFSQELRLVSPQDESLRWSAGLFYFDQKNSDPTLLGIDAGPAIDALGLPPEDITFLLVSETGGGNWVGIRNPILPQASFQDGSDLQAVILNKAGATQYSAFGSVEYDFSDRLTGTTELRYTYEERTLENVFDTFFGSLPGSFKDDWSFWDPRFTARFQATDDLMVYGSVAHGTRSGGQNVSLADGTAQPFDEETNWTYELGAKTSWFDQRLLLNAAVFYIDWNDAQFRQRIPSGAQFLTVTTNSAGVTSSGFELELQAQPFEGLALGATVGYADATFNAGTVASGDSRLCDTISDPALTAFPLIPVTCVPIPGNKLAPDISGKQLQRTAKTTASAFGQYTHPLFGDTDGTVRVDAGYRSRMYQDAVNLASTPERTLVALRLGLENPTYDVSLWVENLLDVDVADTAQVFSSDLNSFVARATAVGINPRRIGLTGRYRFGGSVR